MSSSRRLISSLPVILTLILMLPGDVEARPEFARLTGQACGYCHVSPLGGGPLGTEGLAFKKNLDRMDNSMAPSLHLSTGKKLLHALLWLVHIPFGAGWIILFTLAFFPSLKKGRLVVPPKHYISKMVYCVLFVAVTGPGIVYLLHLGTPNLFSTRFGILLLVKIAGVLTLLIATVVLVWHTNVLLSRHYRALSARLDREEDLELSPEDLQLFDGGEKRSALVAVDGKLYNVTGRDLWRRGIHPGGHRAGSDLTRALARAPHGRDVFERVPPVGELLEKPLKAHPGPRWAVLLGITSSAVILLVVVLWRW